MKGVDQRITSSHGRSVAGRSRGTVKGKTSSKEVHALSLPKEQGKCKAEEHEGK